MATIQNSRSLGGGARPHRELYFAYLDSMRRLGLTNIRYCVAPHLMLHFNLSRECAAVVLGDWIRVRAQEVARG